MKNDLLKDSFKKLNIPVDENILKKFDVYYELLIEWNKKVNLTAITEYEDVVRKHFIDSVLICTFLDFKTGTRIIDIGTGAGFPGIPLKILNPDCSITLLDSLNKRIKFLDTVISELGLSDIECIHGRAENVAREKEYRASFDFSVSRAVANLSTLCEYCIPFLKERGKFISYKSEKSDDEIKESENAVKCLNSEITSVKKVLLPDTDIVRKFVVIENKKKVSGKYPRKAGIPAKDPL